MPGDQPNQDVNISGARGGGTPTDETPGAEARSFQTKPDDVEPTGPGMGPEDAGDEGYPFDPSTAEVNRTRLGGVGQKELNAQRDPTRGFEPTAPVATEAEMSQTPDPERTDRGQTFGGPDKGNS